MGIRTIVTGVVFWCVLSFWALAIQAQPETQAGTVVLKFGTVAPEKSIWETVIRHFDSYAKKYTQGQLQLDFGFGGKFGGEKELLRLCQMGKVDLIAVSSTIIASVLPELNLLEMPYLFNNYEEVDLVIEKLLDEDVTKKLQEKGLVLLGWGDNGFKHLATANKPIRNPADLKRLRLRSQQSEVYAAIFKQFGASPVSINVVEVAPGLQSGIVDGFDNTPLFTYSSGLYHYIHYYTLTGHTFQPVMILASKKIFDRLAQDHKKALLQFRESDMQSSREIVRATQPVMLEKLKQAGIQMIDLTLEQRAAYMHQAKGVYDKAKQLLGENGYRLLQEARELLQQYRRPKVTP